MILPENEPLRWFVPATTFESDGAGGWSAAVVSEGLGSWEWKFSFQSATNMTAFYPGFIDLGGFVREGRTFNPLSFNVSRWYTPGWIEDPADPDPPAPVYAYLTWFTSTREIPVPDPTLFAPMAYSIESAETFGDLVGYQNQAWTTNTTITNSLMQQLDIQTLGTLQPTAGAGLHTLFMVQLETTANTYAGDVLGLPPSVVTIAQEVVKEDELEYVYRLKRLSDLNQDEN